MQVGGQQQVRSWLPTNILKWKAPFHAHAFVDNIAHSQPLFCFLNYNFHIYVTLTSTITVTYRVRSPVLGGKALKFSITFIHQGGSPKASQRALKFSITILVLSIGLKGPKSFRSL